MIEYAVQVQNAIKIYAHRVDNSKISALQGCDLFVKKGELVTVIGPSGAGKTTLLQVIAGTVKLSSGIIRVGDIEIQDWNETKRREFRRKYIGTFSQLARENFDLKMSVRDAIKWELLHAQWDSGAANVRIDDVLHKLNLQELEHAQCGQLSAGEAMRVSLAKAIAKKPFVVLADEPTGQLDTENMHLLFQLMKEVTSEGTGVIVATHDIRFQALADRSLLILDGKLATEEEGAELVSQHRLLGSLLQKKPVIQRNALLDSTHSIRMPDSILKRLNVRKRLLVSHDLGNDFAVVRKHPDDDEFAFIEEESAIEIPDFSRNLIKDSTDIEVINLCKSYGSNAIFTDLSFKFNKGELVVLLGPSGVGKTTLLTMIAGLERASSGKIIVKDTDFSKGFFSKKENTRLKHIAYLTQNYILHPYLSVKANVELPRIMKGEKEQLLSAESQQYLDVLGIGQYSHVYPLELSGGQKQRVALAAMLYKDTDIILADEPTANLDSRLARVVMNVLTDLAETGKTIVVATHDLMLIRPGYRVLRMEENSIVEDVIADEAYCLALEQEFLHT